MFQIGAAKGDGDIAVFVRVPRQNLIRAVCDGRDAEIRDPAPLKNLAAEFFSERRSPASANSVPKLET
ncbi:MAG: hypothetical protein DMG59_26160 [Acidobacteria bacterium]|nr:MAG: hypothetical protein DMG59_26160 [Acidobacteriota bacterium]